MSSKVVPTHTQVLVIGGGPAGSYSAAILAREGFSVTLLEAQAFPRYHIGESMLPSVRPFLRFIGADEKVATHGFCRKPGAAVKFQQSKQEGYTDFTSLATQDPAWNVIRSEFDEILLRHAEELGALVYERHRVLEIQFADDDASTLRPTSAVFSGPSGVQGSISFDYLIDASGRTGMMSTKYMKNRRMNSSLHNVASWGYWTGTNKYKPGTSRDNAPWFEALTDGTGWAWFIPLHNGSVSVGVVSDQASDIAKRSLSSKDGRRLLLKEHYFSQLQLAPNLHMLLGDGVLIEEEQSTCVRSASDFSYAADCYAGDHFRLVGDASAFIDPFFSSGVHLALSGALSAATSISAAVRGDCSESDAACFHDQKIAVAYTRFLLVVMSAYKQIRSQDIPILSDVNEDNFDRAFDILRPVIQGTADIGKTLAEDELQKTMDFCKHVFAPTDPEMHAAVGARLGPELCSPLAPILTKEQIDAALPAGDKVARLVVKEINARKAVHTMYTGPVHLSAESVNGLTARLECGQLGLSRAL
ncbi:hypothetical protein HGRIS_005680 [Hohenbuehelia grisea]|uniref:FAD-binding domain-containing protein n=1 Tax=Hohenbuehelia grisea TaxID=104357 RepID=A0ABR3JYN2_9AGAR